MKKPKPSNETKKLAKRVMEHLRTLSPEEAQKWWLERAAEAISKGEDPGILQRIICKKDIPGIFCVYKAKNKDDEERELINSFPSLSEAIAFVKNIPKDKTKRKSILFNRW